MTQLINEDSEPSTDCNVKTTAEQVVIVDISPHFRDVAQKYLNPGQIEELRIWMSVAKDFGDECGPHGIRIVDFPASLRYYFPVGWKIFFCFNEITNVNCEADLTLLGADKPDKQIWDRVRLAAGGTAYLAGRFFDGVFSISGK